MRSKGFVSVKGFKGYWNGVVYEGCVIPLCFSQNFYISLHRIYIEDIPFSVTSEQLKEFEIEFPFNDVSSCNVVLTVKGVDYEGWWNGCVYYDSSKFFVYIDYQKVFVTENDMEYNIKILSNADKTVPYWLDF